jgi:hypothetical protein
MALPQPARGLLSVAVAGSVSAVAVSLATGSLLLPYHKETSVLDFAVAVAVLGGLVLAASARAEGAAASGAAPSGGAATEGVTTLASGSAVVVAVFAATKAATLDWKSGAVCLRGVSKARLDFSG